VSATSIDDLLGYEDETAPSSGRRGIGGVVKAVLLGAAATAAIVLGLRAARIAVPVALVAAGVYALLVLRAILRAVRATAAAPLRRRTYDDGGEYAFDGYYLSTPDAMRRAVLRWEHRLAWHADAPSTFAVQFQPFLRELADERLRQGYGVTIAGDPARARRVLGESLWEMLTGEHRRAPGPRELASAVAALERLRTSTWEGHERA
jgi:hypothetical protein